MFRRWVVVASTAFVTVVALIGGFAPAGAVGAAGELGASSSGWSAGRGGSAVAASGRECPSSGVRGVTTQTFSTGESRFNPLGANQGWYGQYDVNGEFGESDDRNDQYVVGWDWDPGGDLYPWEWRNFFTFDLSRLTSHVLCARLEVYSYTLQGQPVEQLGLFDVSTPAERLNGNNDQALAVYDDLGTGADYGRYNVDTTRDNEWLTFRLNPAAVQEINEATGYFSVGGRLLSIDRNSKTGGTQNLFRDCCDSPHTVQLVVETIPEPTCFGVPATIVGTDGNDDLVGTDGPDVIASFGGNDVVHPGDGDDLTCAGPGDDVVSDRAGDDKINGEEGSDQLGGGFGDDRLLGGAGDDRFDFGDAQSDRGNDVMVGNEGNDTFSRESGDDVGYGGAGADWWTSDMGGGSQSFYGGPDDDGVRINIEGRDFPENPAPYTVHVSGGLGDDQIGVFNIIPTGTRLFGGPGDDSIEDADADGRDLLRGGPGNDTLRVQSPDPDIPTAGKDYRLNGGRGSDFIVGSPRRDFIRGGPAGDTLEGRAGNDVIRGRGGADTLRGNRGADTLRGGRDRDTNLGGPGSDLCRSPFAGPRAVSCER